ncbi:MAG: helix-turn-helix transcriptional regulator [bacterium]|nr:helix-turn-helix transcriptional regulator [bacterium]
MKNLKRYRTASGMSQTQLSEASGVSLRKIQGYEQGNLDINKGEAIGLYKLSKALGCRMEQLLELDVLQTPMTVTQALLLFAEHAPYHTEQCLELIRHIELGDKEIFGRKGVQYIAAHLDEYLDFPVEVQQPLRQVIDRWMAEHPAT